MYTILYYIYYSTIELYKIYRTQIQYIIISKNTCCISYKCLYVYRAMYVYTSDTTKEVSKNIRIISKFSHFISYPGPWLKAIEIVCNINSNSAMLKLKHLELQNVKGKQKGKQDEPLLKRFALRIARSLKTSRHCALCCDAFTFQAPIRGPATVPMAFAKICAARWCGFR